MINAHIYQGTFTFVPVLKCIFIEVGRTAVRLYTVKPTSINMHFRTGTKVQGRSYRKILGGADIPASFGTLLSYIPFLSRVSQKIFDCK